MRLEDKLAIALASKQALREECEGLRAALKRETSKVNERNKALESAVRHNSSTEKVCFDCRQPKAPQWIQDTVKAINRIIGPRL